MNWFPVGRPSESNPLGAEIEGRPHPLPMAPIMSPGPVVLRLNRSPIGVAVASVPSQKYLTILPTIHPVSLHCLR